jgi:hypothetical protein
VGHVAIIRSIKASSYFDVFIALSRIRTAGELIRGVKTRRPRVPLLLLLLLLLLLPSSS